MPEAFEGSFYDLHRLPSWSQYALAAKSLMKALEVDDPEETVMLQLMISELSMVSFALLVLARQHPEFAFVASNLSTKISEVSEAQNFLRRTKGEE